MALGGFTFRPNRNFANEVASDAKMRAYLENVAEDAVTAVRSQVPHPDILGGLTVDHEMTVGVNGWEAEVRLEGPGWHLYEYGTSKYGPRPALRPGVQAALTPRGGRLGESR